MLISFVEMKNVKNKNIYIDHKEMNSLKGSS